MDKFSEILELQGDLLTTKGYDEKGLNSPDKPGRFLKQVERQFSLALREAHTLNETVQFDIKSIGFFNDDADLIVFTFNYEYNPEKQDLSIKSLEAKMNGEELRFDLKKNKDLPDSTAVHRGFAKDKKIELARAIAEHTVNSGGKRLLKTGR